MAQPKRWGGSATAPPTPLKITYYYRSPTDPCCKAGVPTLFSLESYFQNDQLNKIYPPKKCFIPLLKCT